MESIIVDLKALRFQDALEKFCEFSAHFGGLCRLIIFPPEPHNIRILWLFLKLHKHIEEEPENDNIPDLFRAMLRTLSRFRVFDSPGASASDVLFDNITNIYSYMLLPKHVCTPEVYRSILDSTPVDKLKKYFDHIHRPDDYDKPALKRFILNKMPELYHLVPAKLFTPTQYRRLFRLYGYNDDSHEFPTNGQLNHDIVVGMIKSKIGVMFIQSRLYQDHITLEEFKNLIKDFPDHTRQFCEKYHADSFLPGIKLEPPKKRQKTPVKYTTQDVIEHIKKHKEIPKRYSVPTEIINDELFRLMAECDPRYFLRRRDLRKMITPEMYLEIYGCVGYNETLIGEDMVEVTDEVIESYIGNRIMEGAPFPFIPSSIQNKMNYEQLLAYDGHAFMRRITNLRIIRDLCAAGIDLEPYIDEATKSQIRQTQKKSARF